MKPDRKIRWITWLPAELKFKLLFCILGNKASSSPKLKKDPKPTTKQNKTATKDKTNTPTSDLTKMGLAVIKVVRIKCTLHLAEDVTVL